MKKSLLSLWVLIPLVSIAHDTPKTASDSTLRPKDGIGYIKYTMMSAGSDNENPYTKEMYIACKAKSVYHRAYNELYLSSPFILDKYPPCIREKCFFMGTIRVESGYSESEFPDGAMFAETVSKSPVWNIDNDGELNLDYHIYFLPLYRGHNIDKQLEMPPDKILKTELAFFSPYFEKDGSSYVLTWNPAETVLGSARVNNGMLFFPFRDEPGTRWGAVVSPVLSCNKTTSNELVLYGKIGNSTLWCFVVLSGTDNNGKTWVLSWKKVKWDELQKSGQYTKRP